MYYICCKLEINSLSFIVINIHSIAVWFCGDNNIHSMAGWFCGDNNIHSMVVWFCGR